MPPAENQVRQIRIKVDTSGEQNLKKIAQDLGEVNQSVSGLSRGMGTLRDAFLGYYAALRLGDFARVSDSMTNLFSRLKILTGSTDEAQTAFNGLVAVSDRTRASISDVGNTYARLGATIKNTGADTDVLLGLTETLQNTFRLSGATAEEAASSSIQLSQGLAIGVLRGQDLRSVLSSNVVFGDLLSKTFKIQRGDILKLAEDGYFTASKVLTALIQNMKDTNTQAQTMTVTFQQGLTKAYNAFAVAVFGLNQQFGLSTGFSKGIDILIEKASLIGVVIGGLSTFLIPSLIGGIKALTTTLYGLAASNPILAFFTILGAVIIYSYQNLTQFKNDLFETAAALVGFAKYLADAANGVLKFIGAVDASGTTVIDDLVPFFLKAQASVRSFKTEIAKPPSQADLDKELKAMEKKYKDFLAHLKAMENNKGEEKTIKELYGELNTAFLEGKVNLEQYVRKLNDLDMNKLIEQFTDGKITLEGFNTGLIKTQELIARREFNTGAIDVKSFTDRIRNLKLADLNNQLANGKIELHKYNEELLKLQTGFNTGLVFRVGIQNYLDSIGSLATGVAGVVTKAFSHLEDALVDFTKTGKFNFGEFTKAVLDDLQRIILRSLVIAPLAKGLLNALPSGGSNGFAGADTTSTGTVAANGAAFEMGTRKFAAGGIVSSPTLFGYGGGQRGLMGEAGSEAILPLSRGANGKLGVQAASQPVVINVINNNGSEVETQETVGGDGSRMIEVMIKNKVGEGISQGSFDKVFASSFGLKRKGS